MSKKAIRTFQAEAEVTYQAACQALRRFGGDFEKAHAWVRELRVKKPGWGRPQDEREPKGAA